jgi:hypothetical protein
VIRISMSDGLNILFIFDPFFSGIHPLAPFIDPAWKWNPVGFVYQISSLGCEMEFDIANINFWVDIFHRAAAMERC